MPWANVHRVPGVKDSSKDLSSGGETEILEAMSDRDQCHRKPGQDERTQTWFSWARWVGRGLRHEWKDSHGQTQGDPSKPWSDGAKLGKCEAQPGQGGQCPEMVGRLAWALLGGEEGGYVC